MNSYLESAQRNVCEANARKRQDKIMTSWKFKERAPATPYIYNMCFGDLGHNTPSAHYTPTHSSFWAERLVGITQ